MCMLLVRLALVNIFVPCTNWKTLLFIKVNGYSDTFLTTMFLLPLKSVFWKNFVFYALFPQYQSCMILATSSTIKLIMLLKFVGKKAKGRISKRVFQGDKASRIFRNTNISYPLIRTRTCAYQGVRNVCFSKNLACFVFMKH